MTLAEQIVKPQSIKEIPICRIIDTKKKAL